MNAPNTDAQTFKVKDAGSYDPVVQAFDVYTRRLSQPLASRLVALTQLRGGNKVLDIGTGTGVVAMEAAQQVGPDGMVFGIDLSEPMLRTAAHKAAQAGLRNVEYPIMDAESLALEDKSFDAVVSLFALLHFPDPRAALREMYRVLRPGGRIGIAIGSSPTYFSWDGLVQAAKLVRKVWLQKTGKLLIAPVFLDRLLDRRLPPSHDPQETSLAGQKSHRANIVPVLVREAGFSELSVSWRGHVEVVERPEEFWEMQSTFSSIARKRLGAALPAQVEAVKAEFLEKCRRVQSRGGQLIYPYAALFVVARRPQQENK